MTKTPEELTKDWKEGKLKQGWYFTSTAKGEVCPNLWFDDEWNDFMGMVEEVLAPCDYDEYKAMQEQLNKEGTWYTEISYKKIKKENNQLRDLLRECKRHLYFQKKINNEVITLLTRISAALGESEE